MDFSALTLTFLIVGYLSGSIPFGLLITRMGGAGDVRSIGSGNIGATNVLRTGNKGLAAGTLLCDALKGTLPVLIGLSFSRDAGFAAAIGAFLGHLYPVWLRFKGGKGIATYVGLLIAFWWQGLAAFALVWLLTAYATRYSSLAALLATIAAPLAFYLASQTDVALLFFALSAIVWPKHRDNIRRLISGTESRIGQKSGAAS